MFTRSPFVFDKKIKKKLKKNLTACTIHFLPPEGDVEPPHLTRLSIAPAPCPFDGKLGGGVQLFNSKAELLTDGHLWREEQRAPLSTGTDRFDLQTGSDPAPSIHPVSGPVDPRREAMPACVWVTVA